MLILVPERRVADQEDVQDDTAGPYVDWFPVRLLLQHLRAEVAGCPSETFFYRYVSFVSRRANSGTDRECCAKSRLSRKLSLPFLPFLILVPVLAITRAVFFFAA